MSLIERYIQTRAATEKICAPLNIEDYIPQAVDFASPPKWHLAHTAWFFEEMILKPYSPNYREYDSEFGFLFNSYYQSIGERSLLSQRGIITRPTVADVYSYREHVDAAMSELLSDSFSPELESLVILGINHEQQHQELLLTDMKYVFGLNPTFPVYDITSNLVDSANARNGWVNIDTGLYSVGYAGDEFCFDNERDLHKVHLNDFQIAQGLVTNGEYLEFIEAGGYDDFQYWLDDGWAWLNEQLANQKRVAKPLYWHKVDDAWFYYTLAGLQPLKPEALLAHVSYYEANAYAAWKGMRLPTEFEWEVASSKFDWGDRWEWTSSAYQPYPGFCVGDGAVGEYNGKFMINQMVLRGASVATAKGHSRSTYRNFFQPQMQWQYSGIRLVR